MSDPSTPTLRNIDYSESMNVGRVHESVKREKDIREPGNEPVSLGVYLLLTPLLLLAGGFFGLYHDGGQAPKAPDFDASLIPAGGGGEVDPVAEGKKLFGSVGCAACHQPAGQGQAGIYPPLVDSEWVKGSDKRMAMIIHGGLVGPITVKGNLYNNNMPAQGPLLTPKKMAYIMSFIRHTWGGGASLVTPEQTQLVYDEFKDRTAPWTVDELEKTVPEGEMLPKVGGYGGDDEQAAPDSAGAAAPADAQ
ncbi:MAG: cytochrome c [Verrucomicrobiales bacterium]|nr:cytochrome c [Verrucomicrobiae bacterium]